LSLVGGWGVLPRGEFGVEERQSLIAAVKTLASEGGQLDPGDVEP